MADPIYKRFRMAFPYLVTGHVWKSFVDDSDATENTLPSEENTEVGPPLMMLRVGESRNGVGPYGSPGLNSYTNGSNPDFMSVRWVRVVTAPGDGTSVNEAIRGPGEGTNDKNTAWFEVDGWSENLPENGWGGCEVNLTIHDPSNLYGGEFIAGRSMSISVREYDSDDGYNWTLRSAREEWSGFVISAESLNALAGISYRVRGGTVEQLFLMKGNDGGASVFISQEYADEGGTQDLGGSTLPAGGIVAANPKHIIDPLTPGRVVAHLMNYHAKVRINGGTYRLREVVDFIRDYWNDIPASLARIPAMGISDGNLFEKIAGIMPQGVFKCYCRFNSGIVVTIIHELKATGDPVLDIIDINNCHQAWFMGGINDTIGQVLLPQSPSVKQLQTEEPKIFKFPASPIANRRVYIPPGSYLVKEDAGGALLAEGIMKYENAQDRYLIHTFGAKFSLHNVGTIVGNNYFVEGARIEADWDNCGGLEKTLRMKMIG